MAELHDDSTRSPVPSKMGLIKTAPPTGEVKTCSTNIAGGQQNAGPADFVGTKATGPGVKENTTMGILQPEAAQTEGDASTGFLDLHAELRVEIYEWHISGITIADFRSIKTPALCQVNQQIRSGSLPVLHDFWANSKEVQTDLVLRHTSKPRQQMLERWLPIMGPLILPHIRIFKMHVFQDGGRANIFIAIDPTEDEIDDMEMGKLWHAESSVGETDVYLRYGGGVLPSRRLKRSASTTPIAEWVEKRMKGKEDRRLTVMQMDKLSKLFLLLIGDEDENEDEES